MRKAFGYYFYGLGIVFSIIDLLENSGSGFWVCCSMIVLGSILLTD